jgi:haloalkane dehalogenase
MTTETEPHAADVPISADFPFTKKRVPAGGLQLAYFEVGSGDPIVFLHGDLMSSYLWRNVVPHLQDCGRCIAIDLAGAGDSDKVADSSPGAYGYFEHRRYLDAALEALGVTTGVTFVAHDWGATLAMDWAVRHPGAVKAIAFTEAVLPPFEWEDWPEGPRMLFRLIKSPEGERAVLEGNIFVETAQRGMVRELSAMEWEHIRRPFLEPGEGRRPTYEWPSSVPLGGEPRDIHDHLVALAADMATTQFPKLFINSTPGGIMCGRRAEGVRGWNNLTEVVVNGAHWPPEDDPHGVGRRTREWIRTRVDGAAERS